MIERDLEQMVLNVLGDAPERKWDELLNDQAYVPLLEQKPHLRFGPFVKSSAVLTDEHRIDISEYGIPRNFERAMLGLLKKISNPDKSFSVRRDKDFINNFQTALSVLKSYYDCIKLDVNEVNVLNPNLEMKKFLSETHGLDSSLVHDGWGRKSIRTREGRGESKDDSLKFILSESRMAFDNYRLYLDKGKESGLLRAIEGFSNIGNVEGALYLAKKGKLKEKEVEIRLKHYGYNSAVTSAKKLLLHDRVVILNIENNRSLSAAEYVLDHNLGRQKARRILETKFKKNGYYSKQAPRVLEIIRRGRFEREILPALLESEEYYIAGIISARLGLDRQAAEKLKIAGMAELEIAQVVGFKPDILLDQINYYFNLGKVLNISGKERNVYIERCRALALEANDKGLDGMSKQWYRSLKRAEYNGEQLQFTENNFTIFPSIYDSELRNPKYEIKKIPKDVLSEAETAFKQKLFRKAVALFLQAGMPEAKIIKKLGISYRFPINAIRKSSGKRYNDINIEPEYYSRYCLRNTERAYDLDLIATGDQWWSSSAWALSALPDRIFEYMFKRDTGGIIPYYFR